MKEILLDDAQLDAMCRKIVHRRGQCQKCGKWENKTTAHIIRRGFHWTRWLPQNCLLLCFDCHRYFTDHPKLWENYCRYKIGDKFYEYLYKLSLNTEKVPRLEIYTMLQEQLL